MTQDSKYPKWMDGLSGRAKNVLMEFGYTTQESVRSATYAELSVLSGAGYKTIDMILKHLGLVPIHNVDDGLAKIRRAKDLLEKSGFKVLKL